MLFGIHGKIVIICPGTYLGGSSPLLARRDWPLNNWHKLIDLLNCAGMEPKILIPNQLSPDYKIFKSQIVLAETVADLVSIIKSAHLVITQDSGYMHVARYVGVKCIALFGPTDPIVFATAETKVVKVEIHCSPCHNGRNFERTCEDNICMKKIEPIEVFKLVSNERS